MGRSSSTALPYLVARADAGQYTYHRQIPAVLAPRVVGSIDLPWSGDRRTLTGRRTIKLSLGVGDEKIARQRWTEVHPQVEALVRLAEIQLRDEGRREPRKPVPRLDPARIRTVAEQAYHDVLAADDRGQVEPGYASPLAQVLLRVAGGAAAPAAAGVMVAERAARVIERRMHAARLRERNTWLLDKPIVEEDLADDPAGILATDQGEGDRLAPEQVEALARGIRIGEIPSEVEQRLRENGLDLPPGHVDRRALALAITRAKLRALQDVRKRDHGAPVDTPERPATLKPAPAAPEPVPCLSAMLDRWIALKRPDAKQIGDGRRSLRLFTSQHGDLPVDQITGRHVRLYRDALLGCPRNAPQHLATASIADLSAWAKAHPQKRKLGRGTINHKGVGTIATLLGQAQRDEYIRANPADGQHLPTGAGDKQEIRPYRADELDRVFGTAIYRGDPGTPKGGKAWAAYWLPLLSLYTGARLEELGQALVSDVRRTGDIHYLDITTLTDDDDDPDAGKSLKTGASRRRIPLHHMLIRFGFLDYVETLKTSGAKRLFPALDLYRGRCTKNWSRWWGRWMTKLALADPSLTFHSFRHAFTAELRRTRCDQSVMKELLGHTQSDTTSGYGRTNGFLHQLGDLNEGMQRISYPKLDLAHLEPLRPWRVA